ncbi:TetR/AcrR family transcriptional regulator [Burkholderia sp. Bp9140]|uniref:TetR/AcrR family transcriptional regulator n=1 Tax=Burkholderia sp. Bp9140 TaxID=2184572 RepID=UPI000F5645FB|nr:TetR/AcrR family transcriptional regulator [Burkholderia sp. Bp9140]RQR45997.1 TetR/AcrR family transcriptional regulator [Burkholderia sp. Bp9140]
MSNALSRKTGTSPAEVTADKSPPAREPRGARRKRETRLRLLEAALRLMAEKGMEGVAINEITEAADVGFGSFYNHFESKEAIHAALSEWVFDEFADTLDRLGANLTDPAEVIAVSVRHTLLRARRERVWGRFLIREGLSARILTRGLGPRLERDLQKGINAGRFGVDDPLMALVSVGGTVLVAIAAELNFGAGDESAPDILAAIGYSRDRFAERAAAAVLQTLGISRDEAIQIANLPLPNVAVESAPE